MLCACTHTSPFKCFKTAKHNIILLNFLQAATTTLFVAHYISLGQAHYAVNPGNNKELQGLGM